MTAALAEEERWSLPKRVAFRFALVLFPLLLAPSPLESIPLAEKLGDAYLGAKAALGAWIALHLLHRVVPHGAYVGGGGILGWTLVVAEVAVAAIACAVWTAVDRRPKSHRRLLEGLRIYLRFTLCAVMLTYGFAKVFCVQFPAPSNVILSRMIGDFAPADLLWTFMGASRGYQIFGGLAEVLGAALLAFRRTTTLGALILVGVLANVVALNVFYDVNVKLWSATLLATAALLALPDAERLARALLSTRAVQAKPEVSLFTSARGVLVARLVRVAFALAVALPIAWLFFDESHPRTNASVAPIAGFYAAESGCAVTSESHQLVAVDVSPSYAHFLRADCRSARYTTPGYDPATKTLTVFDRAHDATYSLTADVQDAELHVSGVIEGMPIDARLLRADPQRFSLVSHGIH